MRSEFYINLSSIFVAALDDADGKPSVQVNAGEIEE